MDLTDSFADWMSQFDYSGHGWEDEIPSFHSSMLQDSHGDCGERAAKILKINSSSSSTSSANLCHFSGGSGLISFGSSPPFEQTQLHPFDVKPPKLEPAVSSDVVGLVEGATADESGAGWWRRGSGAVVVGGGGNMGMKEHVIAERKRREKLCQRFISLSSLLPGLKKMDKASVLGEAARCVKQLQEQVKTLEEDLKSSKRAVESIIVARSPKINSSIEDGNMSSSSSSNDNVESSSSGDHLLPEIEARFSNKDVLIRVHCMRNQGIVPKVLQKLRLGIVNCNSMPFGRSAMVITVVAEMDDEFSATSMELVNMIREPSNPNVTELID